MKLKLINKIEDLKTKISSDINNKLKEFKKQKDLNQIFIELCFCILVANSSVEKTQKIWNKINKGFLNFSEEE